MIEFLVAGPADGLPLVLHEGTPCGLVLYPPTVRAAAIRGLRVVLAARPGYEGSTPRPGRRVVDVAEDTAAVLDDLGAGTLRHAGLVRRRPARAGLRRGPARPLPGRGVDRRGGAVHRRTGWTGWAAWAPENVAEFGAALRGEAALTEFLGREAAMMGAITGESVASSLGGLVIEADKAVLTGEFAGHVAACLRTALSWASRAGATTTWRSSGTGASPSGWESPSPAPGDPAPVDRLAGRPGPDGPVRARAVAGRPPSGAPAFT